VRVEHPWRLISGIVVIAVVAIVGYTGWLVYDAAHHLKAAADDASAIRAAALGDDPAKAKAAINDFSGQAHSAAKATGSPFWGLLTHVPGFGDDARGVRTASNVADDLSDGPLTELAGAVGDIDAVLPKNGGVDVASVQGLATPVADGSAALDKARQQLDAVDPSGYVDGLKTRFRDLQSKVDDAADAMGVANRALKVLPQMLGADGKHNYLVVMQNNAEIRATGGLPGAVSLVSADDGKISMVREVAGSSFGQAPAPVLPLQPAEQKLFGKNLGTFFLDANLTPDFARSSDLWKARWEQTQPEKIDGVISMDTVTLSYLLKALGPVDVAGVHLTSANVVDELLSKVYARIPDPKAEDAFFGQVSSTIFQKILTFSGSRQTLLQALGQAADEHRLLIHDYDSDVQADLAGTAVAGEVTKTGPDNSVPTTPQVGVYFADGTLSKMSYYLRYNAHVSATSCVGGVQKLSGKLTLTSTAPKDAKTTLPSYVTGTGLPKSKAGDMMVVVYVYAPEGGTASKFDDNDLDYDQFSAELDGRPVIGTWVLLQPGESQDLNWTMTSGKGQTGNTSVAVTPSVAGGSASSTAASACS